MKIKYRLRGKQPRPTHYIHHINSNSNNNRHSGFHEGSMMDCDELNGSGATRSEELPCVRHDVIECDSDACSHINPNPKFTTLNNNIPNNYPNNNDINEHLDNDQVDPFEFLDEDPVFDLGRSPSVNSLHAVSRATKYRECIADLSKHSAGMALLISPLLGMVMDLSVGS